MCLDQLGSQVLWGCKGSLGRGASRDQWARQGSKASLGLQARLVPKAPKACEVLKVFEATLDHQGCVDPRERPDLLEQPAQEDRSELRARWGPRARQGRKATPGAWAQLDPKDRKARQAPQGCQGITGLPEHQGPVAMMDLLVHQDSVARWGPSESQGLPARPDPRAPMARKALQEPTGSRGQLVKRASRVLQGLLDLWVLQVLLDPGERSDHPGLRGAKASQVPQASLASLECLGRVVLEAQRVLLELRGSGGVTALSRSTLWMGTTDSS